jgi:hypothetical protein
MNLNYENDMIIFGDSKYLKFFKKTYPNFNMNKPNLLNFYQNNLYNDIMKPDN